MLKKENIAIIYFFILLFIYIDPKKDKRINKQKYKETCQTATKT